MPVKLRLSTLRISLISAASFAAMGLAAYLLYGTTKNSYYAVGFNDGLISSNADLMRRISGKLGTDKNCAASEQIEANLIISVKSDALYLVKNSSGQITFCLAR